MKKGLSVEAVNYIRKECEGKPVMRGVTVAPRKDVLMEFQRIIHRSVSDSNVSFDDVSFSCKQDVNQPLTVHTKTRLASASDVTIEIIISTTQKSQIRFHYDGDGLTGEESFFLSPAYKRYFQEYSDVPSFLAAEISTKLITSRHLGDYITHLIDCCEGYFSAVKLVKSVRRVAA